MKFKKGDKVQSQHSGRFGTVVIQMNTTTVIIETDGGERIQISPKVIDLIPKVLKVG